MILTQKCILCCNTYAFFLQSQIVLCVKMYFVYCKTMNYTIKYSVTFKIQEIAENIYDIMYLFA